MAGKVFINYRRDDSASQALNVAQYLESSLGKSRIFIDVDRLRAGQKFPAVLEVTLGQCAVMLAIIGPGWLDARDEKTGARRLDNPSDWVRLEIERALARGVPVIPVLVGGARLPEPSALPASLRPLLDHQTATVTTNGFRHEMAGLARDVADLIRPPSSVRTVAAAGTGLVVLLGAYVVAHYAGVPVSWPDAHVAGSGVTGTPDPRPAAKEAAEPRKTADAEAAAGKTEPQKPAPERSVARPVDTRKVMAAAGFIFAAGRSDAGVRIEQVRPGSAAALQGLKPGNLVASVEGQIVHTAEDIDDAVKKIMGAGRASVTLYIFSKDEFRDVVIALSEPNDAADTAGNATLVEALGISYSSERLATGLRIAGIKPNSDAATKAMKPGDVVLEAGGHTIRTIGDIEDAVREGASAGRSAILLNVLDDKNSKRFVAVRTLAGAGKRSKPGFEPAAPKG